MAVPASPIQHKGLISLGYTGNVSTKLCVLKLSNSDETAINVNYRDYCLKAAYCDLQLKTRILPRVKNWISVLIFSGTALTAYAQTYDINFNVINLNSVSAQDEQRVIDGIQFFNQILQRQCGFNLTANISRRDLEVSNSTFIEDDSWSERHIPGVGSYFFRFYQSQMYSITTENNLQQQENEVSVFVTPSLDACGFAFPDIQFLDKVTTSKNPDARITSHILPWLRNRVIVGATSQSFSDCANSNRLMAHELAHIFIQDESPHTCFDENAGHHRGCPDENVLATRRRIYPEPRPGRPRLPDHGMDEPEIRPAIGTIITPRQCQDILNTVNAMIRD